MSMFSLTTVELLVYVQFNYSRTSCLRSAYTEHIQKVSTVAKIEHEQEDLLYLK
jgi:hypothetical protein